MMIWQIKLQFSPPPSLLPPLPFFLLPPSPRPSFLLSLPPLSFFLPPPSSLLPLPLPFLPPSLGRGPGREANHLGGDRPPGAGPPRRTHLPHLDPGLRLPQASVRLCGGEGPSPPHHTAAEGRAVSEEGVRVWVLDFTLPSECRIL